jgi:hypothetical protein
LLTRFRHSLATYLTVPLCRVHHRELHRQGDERAWWSKLNIDPMPIALRFWQDTRGISTAWQGKAEPQPSTVDHPAVVRKRQVHQLVLISTTRTASMRGGDVSIPNRRGGSPLSMQRQNFFSAVNSRCWYRESAGTVISTHLPPPVITESTEVVELVTHILCRSYRIHVDGLPPA